MWLNANIPSSDASDQKLGGNVSKIMQNTWRIFPFDKWMQILEQAQNNTWKIIKVKNEEIKLFIDL